MKKKKTQFAVFFLLSLFLLGHSQVEADEDEGEQSGDYDEGEDSGSGEVDDDDDDYNYDELYSYEDYEDDDEELNFVPEMISRPLALEAETEERIEFPCQAEVRNVHRVLQ